MEGNKKRSAEHYSVLLPSTLDAIAGSTLVFFSNDQDTIDIVERLARERSIDFSGRVVPVSELPARPLAAAFVDACDRMCLDQFAQPPEVSKEKGVRHYWRDLKGSGAPAYQDMLTIWLSKVPITSEIARTGPKARETAWIDVSLARFNGRRENAEIDRLILPETKLSHYGNDMEFYGTGLPLNASFLCAREAIWTTVETHFLEAAKRASKMPYGHDEETVFADCVWRNPELFHCVGQPFERRKLGLKTRLKNGLRAFVRSIYPTS